MLKISSIIFQISTNVMLLILVIAVLFVWTLMVHSHALVILDSREMDSIIVKVTFNFVLKIAILNNYLLHVQISMNVMLLIPVTTVLFVWTVMVHSHALVILDSQEMDSIIVKVTFVLKISNLLVLLILCFVFRHQ